MFFDAPHQVGLGVGGQEADVVEAPNVRGREAVALPQSLVERHLPRPLHDPEEPAVLELPKLFPAHPEEGLDEGRT
jgi:hypothetical protein